MAATHARHGPREAGERAAARNAYRRALALVRAHPERIVTKGSPELRRIPGEDRLGRYFPYMLHAALLVLAECAGDEDEARRHEAAARKIDPTRDPKQSLHRADPHHCQASLGHRRGRPRYGLEGRAGSRSTPLS